MNKEAGRKIIAERVEEFEKNKAILTKKGHGETNIRSNYIDIMFKALGWNMKSHYEVVREFSQRDKSTDGGTKKVDYAFKINGKLKFFIEAKEASVDLEKDKSAIYQAKRYAYSSNGKAPIVILTDFEEFRVFNVIKAPLMDNTDRELLKSHTMRYTDYLDKWDLLWDSFSREAVDNGSLDKLIGKIDKNTKTMDVDFLEQITSWRELLAKNIAIRNENLNVDEINEAVQRILDRLVFIRNLEDREIEPENTLLDKTKKSENIYKSLIPIFNSLNTTYNGLLFKKHFSEDIDVDDKTIKDIIRQMCYPISPFQYDVIEPEILGRIYERFLGSKIRLTDSHRAKIEEKIEVRKAGGVYYTPEYIVEYIVQNTVGKKIEGLTPSEIINIKVVDPACGSGSFLIGAYSYLLDYHQKWYTKNQKDKTYQADWYKTKNGEIKVRLDKRGDILTNNIFGVDIDKEATEVAVMSLYLKMLDDGFDKGERDLFFIKGSVLPDMIENIKCGNSLVETDYFDGQLVINDEEIKTIKPFDWRINFDNIFKNNKFDVVISNPPYFSLDIIDLSYKDYLQTKYNLFATKQSNIYFFFLAISKNLLNDNGLVSFINERYYFNSKNALKFRQFLQDTFTLKEVVDFKNIQIFDHVNTLTVINTFSPHPSGEDIKIIQFENDFRSIDTDDLLKTKHKVFFAKSSELSSKDWSFNDKSHIELKNKLSIHPTLDNYVKMGQGIKSGLNEVFIVDESAVLENKFEKDPIKKYVKTRDIQRYNINYRNMYLLLVLNDSNTSQLPNIISYLEKYKDKLKNRFQYKDGVCKWYSLSLPQNLNLFLTSSEKIFTPLYSKGNKFGFCSPEDDYYALTDTYVLVPISNDLSVKYLLAILNSKLMNFFNRYFGKLKRDGYYEYSRNTLSRIPIKNIDYSNKKEKELYDNLVLLCEQMVNAQKDYYNCENKSKIDIIEQKINIIDNKIDSIIYSLYEITDDEIKMIESD